MGIFDKVTDLAKEHGDKIADGVDKVAEVVDEKTGGKFGDKIDQAGDFVKDKLDQADEN